MWLRATEFSSVVEEAWIDGVLACSKDDPVSILKFCERRGSITVVTTDVGKPLIEELSAIGETAPLMELDCLCLAMAGRLNLATFEVLMSEYREWMLARSIRIQKWHLEWEARAKASKKEFRMKCGNCGELTKKDISVLSDVKFSDSRNAPNLVMKCKFCERRGSMTVVTTMLESH
ncbi:hypothetical protein POM88_033766 [Heracleum sosnowskyi]|uniref:Uncharacterized protein n=1 Tax=Heracleum sosnowskyi TaxID=360622 RepID=A0AAD8HIC6_9APIA|nr:hypothetical protein POM88_033766 [Heracleum sosnowskyi]